MRSEWRRTRFWEILASISKSAEEKTELDELRRNCLNTSGDSRQREADTASCSCFDRAWKTSRAMPCRNTANEPNTTPYVRARRPSQFIPVLVDDRSTTPSLSPETYSDEPWTHITSR